MSVVVWDGKTLAADRAGICGDMRTEATKLFVIIQKIGVDSRNKAMRDDRYVNKRAELYWTLREQFENKIISLPKDSAGKEVVKQLGAITYDHDNKGRVLIVKKDRIKKEIGHSPDEADALALSYAANDKSLMAQKRKPYTSTENKMPKTRGWMGR